MNLEAIRKFLQGKKTYYLAVLALIYLGGGWLGFYKIDGNVLAGFGFGGLITFRAALHQHFPLLEQSTLEALHMDGLPGPGTQLLAGANLLPVARQPEPESASAAGASVTLDPTGTLHPTVLLPFLILAPLLFSGCAFQRVIEFNPETRAITKYTGVAFLNKSALEGLSVGKRTSKSATVFSLEKAGTETQTEAIQALGQALGAGIAEGAKVALTGKP